MSEEMKKRIGEVIIVAPWKELDLRSDEIRIMKQQTRKRLSK